MKAEHHYFATCALGWETGETRDEAVTRLVKRFKSDFREIIKGQQKYGTGFGCYVWLCKVHEKADASYPIEFYQPKGVEVSDAEELIIYRVTGSQIDYAQGNPVTKRIAA